MKRIVAIVALIGILLQTFSQVVIVAQYYANKDYIAKNLCENRDKPMMHCDGKCCLKKKLTKDGKEQGTNSSNTKSEQVVNLFFSHTKFEIAYFALANLPNKYFSYNDLNTSSYHYSVFHPPTA